MELYKYYKGSKQQCDMYNAYVSFNEKYPKGTEQWDVVREIEGAYYVMVHKDYPCELPISDLPKIDLNIDL